MPNPAPGLVLGERYRLDAQVGAGGMATVWRATDLVLERAVAVKVPTEAAEGLRREAKAAAGLTHPHITAVHDYGESGGLPYVVMELLDGENLASRLARGPLPWREAAVIGAGLAGALAAAHEAGVVHRDVKPANVFLTRDGVKVLDFGIAFTPRVPPGGPLRGTPAYVAPETMAGADPAPSADVYALGVVLAEMLGETDAPDEITALISRCRDERPDARPEASEIATVLGRAAGVTAGARTEHPATTPGPPPNLTRVLLDDPGPGAGRRPLLVVAGVTGGIVLLAVVLSLLLRDSSPPRAAAPRVPVPSAPPPAPAATTCSVAYTVSGEWPGGFQAEVRVTNLSRAQVDGWRLAWSFPGGEQITQLWNGAREQSGARVTVTAAEYNRRIPAGGTVQFGFLGRGGGVGGDRPSAFTLNGGTCRSG